MTTPGHLLQEAVAIADRMERESSSEPVAWQKRNANNDWSNIKDCSDQSLRVLDIAGWETRPLYAITPDQKALRRRTIEVLQLLGTVQEPVDPPCASCSLPKSEHHWTGASWPICKKFVEPEKSNARS
jgi:hypothetical protein